MGQGYAAVFLHVSLLTVRKRWQLPGCKVRTDKYRCAKKSFLGSKSRELVGRNGQKVHSVCVWGVWEG